MNDPAGAAPDNAPGALPSTVLLFKVFAGLMVLLGVAMFCGGMAILIVPSLSSGLGSASRPGISELIAVLFYAGLGTIQAVPYVVAIFVKPKRWVWTFDLVLIAFSMIFGCYCWPFAIPLLIGWNKPEVKAYFGA